MSVPTNPKSRLRAEELRIELAGEEDCEEIALGMYVAWPETSWEGLEPADLRPPLQSTRASRLANRLIRPSMSNPEMYWVKAVHVPTNTIAGAAGWMSPKHVIHSIFSPSAADFYKWTETFNWSEADIGEMWTGVDKEKWGSHFSEDGDRIRKEVMGDEPHWYLASLYTLPNFRGMGIASKLLAWATDQADKTEPATPLYLESSAMGRAVYEHVGFVSVGQANYVRRGPKDLDKTRD